MDIFQAIRAGDVAAVAQLIDEDVSVAALCDDQRLSAVMTAAYMRQGEVLALLLAHRADALDIFEAAAVGNEPRVSALIAEDARAAFARSVDGFTALHLAAYFGHEITVKALLARGADANAVAENAMRVQPLHSAVSSGQHAIAGHLIAAGADVNARQQGGFTPLLGAAFGGDLALIELLLASGADPEARSDEGKSAADLAREQGHAEAGERLA